MRQSFTFLVLLASACGQGPADTPTGSATQALVCDTQSQNYGNGVASRIACPFEQQYSNILGNGQALALPKPVFSNGVDLGIKATHVCGSWLLGTDAAGVTVFVNTSNGSVRSHGQVHAGSANSQLPALLSLPIAAQ